MSSAKFIILGDMRQGTEALPTAVYFLKMARKDGNRSLNKTFFFGEIKIRVVLDPHAGDKVYIEPPDCGNIGVSGFLDTYKSKKDTIPATPRYLIEDQLAKEYRVPRSGMSQIPTAKLMYGVRPINPEANLVSALSGGTAPTNTDGEDGDLYMRTDSDQLYQKEDGVWYELVQNTPENPFLTTALPVEATIQEMSEEGVTQYSVATSLFKTTYEKLRPTFFTGIMRQIMQVTFATPSWRGFAPVGDKPALSPVDYKAGNSWGCIKHGKRYHMVQITSGIVYSVPADLCVRQFKDSTGKTKDAITLKSVNVDKKVRIGDITPGLGTSWDQEIGWAFSYTKPEAAIVFNTTKFVGAEEFVATRLLTLTFGFDDKGVLDSATLDATDPEVFWVHEYTNDRYQSGKGLFNIITDLGPELGGLQNVSVDFGAQYAGQNIPGYKANDIPIYVYYTEDGQKLCTYNFSKTDATSSSVSALPTENFTLKQPDCAWGYVDVPVTDYSAVLSQGAVGSWSTGASVTYGFSCAGSYIFEGSGAKNDSYSMWTWEYEYGDVAALVESCWEYQMWYQAYDGNGQPVNNPYLIGPYGTHRFYYNGRKGMRGRDTITNSTGGSVVTCVLTLSTLDRECVLISNSAYTYPITRSTTSNTYVYSTIETNIHVGSGSYGATSIGSVVPIDYTVNNWGVVGIECYKLRGASTPYRTGLAQWPGRRLVTQLLIEPSPTAAHYHDVYRQDGSTIGPGCWGATAKATTTTQYAVYGPPDTDSTTSTAATGVWSNKIYGHGAPIDMSLANVSVIYQLHPKTPMVFWFTQAAYNPSNYATHGAGMNSAAVVKINNTTYDVKNQLFGWIGVA